jgi:hypothetical protein
MARDVTAVKEESYFVLSAFNYLNTNCVTMKKVNMG